MAIKVTLQEVKNAGPKQKALYATAGELLQKALNSPSFAEKIANARYTATWQRDAEHKYTKVPPHKIMQFITSGLEVGTEPDFEIDLYCALEPLRRGILGSTPLGEFPISTAYWFANECISSGDPRSFAAHLMHEWMHVAGFYHAGGNSARGDVAYVVGEIVAEVLRDPASPVVQDSTTLVQ